MAAKELSEGARTWGRFTTEELILRMDGKLSLLESSLASADMTWNNGEAQGACYTVWEVRECLELVSARIEGGANV